MYSRTLLRHLPLILILLYISGCSSCAPFDLRSETTNFTRNHGGSGAQHIFIDRDPGFVGDVTLELTSVPTGVTATFEPPAVSGDVAIVHLALDSSAATGDSELQVRGADPDGRFKFMNIPLGVLGANDEDFGIDASPLTATVEAGGSVDFEVDLQWHGPFADDVLLECQGLPADLTCSFADSPVANGQESTTLTITAAANAADGEHAVTVHGEGGTQAKMTALLLWVDGSTSSGDDDDTVGDDDDSSGDDDDSAGDDDDSAGDDDDSAGDDDDSAGDDDDSADSAQSFAVRSEVSNFSINQEMEGSMTVYVDRSGGHDLPVTLSATADSGLTVSFEEAAPVGGAAVLVLDVGASAATGTGTIAVTGDDGSNTSSADFPVTVNPSAFDDYVLKVNTHSQEIAGGSDGFANVMVQWGGSFTSDVDLTCAAPAEVTCTLGVSTVSHPNTDSAVTLSVSAGAASGVYPVQVEGLGDSISKLVSFQVVVP